MAFFNRMMVKRAINLDARGNESYGCRKPEEGARFLKSAIRWYVWGGNFAGAEYCAEILLKNKNVGEAVEAHLRIGRATKGAKGAVKHFVKAAEIAKSADKNLAVKAYLFAITAAYQAFDDKSACDAVVEAGKLLDGVGRESPYACEVGKWTQLIGSEEMYVHFACNAGLEKAMEALKEVNTPEALARVAKFARFEKVIKGALNKTGEQRLIQICNENYQNGNEQLAGWAAEVLAKRILSLPYKGLEMVALFGGEHAGEAMDNLRDRMMRATYEGNEQEPGVRARETAQCIAVFARVMVRTRYEDVYFGFVGAVEKFVELKKQRCGDDTPALNEDCEKLVEEARKLEGAVRWSSFRSMRLHKFLEQLERLAELPEGLGAEDWARNAPEGGI